MNIGHLLRNNVEQFAEYEALHFCGESFTNRQQLHSAATLAAVFRNHGVKAGDLLMVTMPNSPWVINVFQAAWKLGAAIMPVMPQLNTNEVSYLLRDSEVKTVVTVPELVDKIECAKESSASYAQLLVVGKLTLAEETNLEAHGLPADYIEDRADDDLALLLYTSGTTGHPKGAKLTHGNLWAVCNSLLSMGVQKEPYQRSLLTLPLSHSFGVSRMNAANLFGRSTVLLPKFDIEAVFESIQNYRVVEYAAVPTMLTQLLNYPKRQNYDVSSLEQVSTGGTTLSNELRLEFEREFDCKLIDGYGMTECAPLAACYRPGEAYRPGSVGRAVPNVVISIRDDNDQDLPTGSWGEICIKGPNVMEGYLNKPDATACTVKEGWLYSGDIGYLDEENYLYVTDRKKDIIIKGGENISPREIEEVLQGHSAVAEVAVIGLPDDTYGEEICAVVTVNPINQATAEDLKRHAELFLTKFKIPSQFVFLEELPKSGVGKILKRKLRSQLSR